jgi:hypothetical protein
MSWSVAAVGKAAAVKTEIARQFAVGSKCLEPEETVRQSAAVVMDAALAAQDPTMAVKASASGSMTFKNWDNRTGGSNNLSISIEPLYGFIE